MSTYDVVIVGARLAGAATAMLLARAGIRVLVLDRAAPGTDTLSTHAFMRAGVIQLARWGLLDRVLEETPAITETVFAYGDSKLTVSITERHGVDVLVAPRRYAIDAILVEAARQAGAEIRHHHRVLEVQPGRGVLVQAPEGAPFWIEADFVIGADGVRSRVADAVGARVLRSTKNASGTLYTYVRSLPGESAYVWRYLEGSSAFVIPTGGGTLLSVCMGADRFRTEVGGARDKVFRRLLAEHDPQLAARLPKGLVLKGFAGLPGHLKAPWGEGWALVGDAGYFRDPITAHGMTDALRDAELLANALIAGGGSRNLQRYQDQRDALAEPFLDVTDRIATFAWSLDELEQLHRSAGREMRREADIVARLGQPAAPAWSAAMAG